MRLTFAALGWELDLSLGQAEAAVEEDEAAVLSGGTTASTPISFTSTFEMPDECPLPMRNNGWGDEGNEAR